ncbi:MAG: YkgJ family cysteine cluster protein [Lachnospiraceae bacterium]|nr:YkgJ family cysteine cluster protein [Lachnospiraceae bacterium]
MKRNIDLSEISDGKLYTINDMAKLGCQDCAGCSACCKGMGSSIILDPFDVFRIEKKLNKSFEELLQAHLELNVVDGVILPNLKLTGEEEACSFLNKEGRCSIHDSRPGICRLFPLGRYYEDGDYKYFLQVNECQKRNRTKEKISKWIDTPDYFMYKKFILQWHYFLNDAEEIIANATDENFAKQCCMLILQAFYMKKYDLSKDFYEQFAERLEFVKDALS